MNHFVCGEMHNFKVKITHHRVTKGKREKLERKERGEERAQKEIVDHVDRRGRKGVL